MTINTFKKKEKSLKKKKKIKPAVMLNTKEQKTLKKFSHINNAIEMLKLITRIFIFMIFSINRKYDYDILNQMCI